MSLLQRSVTRLSWLILLVFLLGPAKGQRIVLSIKDMLTFIEKGQPKLQAYRDQSSATAGGIKVIKSSLVPDLTAGYQAGYATDNNSTGMSYPGIIMPISGPVLARNSYELIPGTALTAFLQWTPLTFGQRSAAVEKANAAFRLAGSSYDNALFKERYTGLMTYLRLVYFRKLLDLQQSNIQRVGMDLRQSLVLAKEGLRPGLDTVQFQSLMAQAAIERLKTEKQYQAQILELCRLTGLNNSPEDIVLSDTLIAGDLPVLPDTSGSLTQHPDYLFQQAQVALSDAELKQVQRSWRPKLDLWANAYSRGSGISADGTIDKKAGWSLNRTNYGAGVQLSFPILSFVRINIQRQQYQSLLHADQARLSQEAIDLQRQIRTAENNYDQDLRIAAASVLQRKASSLSYQGLQLSYQNGLVDFTRLTQGQYQLLNAEMMEAEAYLQVWQALLEIGVSKGRLDLFTSQLK